MIAWTREVGVQVVVNGGLRYIQRQNQQDLLMGWVELSWQHRCQGLLICFSE